MDLVSFIRTIIMYLLVVLVMRLMGKRQIGQLQPYEFVIALMISDLAALPMQDSSIPLWSGVVPILSLLLMQLLISFGVLKSNRIRRFMCGRPCVMVRDGVIIEKNLSDQMYTLDDLLEALRMKGCPDVRNVKLAVLENNGELSVLPEGGVTDIVIGGCVIRENMKRAGITREALDEAVRSCGASSVKDVFYCYVNGSGEMTAQKRSACL